MIPVPTLSKTRRHIRVLLALGSLLAVLVGGMGALIFVLGWSRPDVTQPFWETGCYVMLLCGVNLAIFPGVVLAGEPSVASPEGSDWSNQRRAIILSFPSIAWERAGPGTRLATLRGRSTTSQRWHSQVQLGDEAEPREVSKDYAARALSSTESLFFLGP